MSEENKVTGPKTAKKVENLVTEAVVTVLAESNPKREGSAAFDRFQNYFKVAEGSTVKDYIDAGLTMGDIRYDIIHGNIQVEGAIVTEYEVTPRGEKSEAGEAGEAGEADEEEASGF